MRGKIRAAQNALAVAAAVFLSTAAHAGPAKSPQELSDGLRQIIVTKNTKPLEDYVHRDTPPESFSFLEASLSNFDAKGLVVYPVPANDLKAVQRADKDSQVKGIAGSGYKSVEEKVKKRAELGWYYTLKPLGDVLIKGTHLSNPKDSSTLVISYGQLDGVYLLTFAKK
jgi:hypothetical protein